MLFGDEVVESSMSQQYIRFIELDRERIPSFSEYPFNLPAIKKLHRLSFHPEVTFIIGENGSGKSTILESIAVAYGLMLKEAVKILDLRPKLPILI